MVIKKFLFLFVFLLFAMQLFAQHQHDTPPKTEEEKTQTHPPEHQMHDMDHAANRLPVS